MLIPRFWARAEGRAQDSKGQAFQLTVWGWSGTDAAGADAAARERLQRAISRLRSKVGPPDSYAYGARALREEILQELPSPAGTSDGPAAVVTRNRYGCLVLNTDRLLFIDIDLPVTTWQQRLLQVVLRNPPQERRILEETRAALRTFGATTFRIYRTAAGFRVMAIDREFGPEAPDTRKLMERCKADPHFVRLCSAQKSFRARLTPKPWRCGSVTPPGQFPREVKAAQAFVKWLADYEGHSRAFATCRFVETVGNGVAKESLKELIALHDKEARVDANLPLA